MRENPRIIEDAAARKIAAAAGTENLVYNKYGRGMTPIFNVHLVDATTWRGMPRGVDQALVLGFSHSADREARERITEAAGNSVTFRLREGRKAPKIITMHVLG